MAQEIEFPQFHDSLDEIAPPCASTRLFGHQTSVARMMAAAKGGHHALILDGEQGIGKASAAFHLANWLLDGAADTLDGALPAHDIEGSTYRQIAQNVHPNLLYLTRPLRDDGKAFKTVITVDEVRRLQKFLGMTASGGDRRVIIIDSLGDMNKNAANAVLKLLEEPPANTLFLLIAHGLGGLLATIRSRCQVIRFSPLEEVEASSVLAHVAAHMMDENEIARLAALSGGSVRHALLMALNGGLELRENIQSFLESPTFNTAAAHKLAEVAGTRGSDIHNSLLRDMMLSFVRERALNAVQAGDTNRAARLARFDSDYSERIRIADGYNLDRKQEFLVTANQIHGLFHSS